MLETVLATETHLPDVNRSAGDFASQSIWGEPGRLFRFCSLTVLDAGKPIAAIILHNWQPDTGVIEITAAGSGRWQSRRIINEVFGLCFDAMGCQMAAMRIGADNAKSVENARRLGFTGHLIPRLRGRNEDEWIFTLTAEDWQGSRLYKARSDG